MYVMGLLVALWLALGLLADGCVVLNIRSNEPPEIKVISKAQARVIVERK